MLNFYLSEINLDIDPLPTQGYNAINNSIVTAEKYYRGMLDDDSSLKASDKGSAIGIMKVSKDPEVELADLVYLIDDVLNVLIKPIDKDIDYLEKLVGYRLSCISSSGAALWVMDTSLLKLHQPSFINLSVLWIVVRKAPAL